MAHPLVTLGIAGFGFAFGEDQDVKQTAGEFVSDPERVVRWGYHTFHRAPTAVTQVSLAARAADDVLTRTGLTADSLDLITVAASELPEYPYWDSSGALARELKIGQTQTLLLNEGCACGVTGLGMVAGQLAVQPELNTVLFVAVNRVSEFHRNRMNVNNAVHSDGAVAVVLRRNHRHNRWLATYQFTDPDMCDWFRTDYGGSVAPVPPPGWSSATAVSGLERVQEHFGRDPQRLRAFNEQLNARVVEVIDGACRRAGIDRSSQLSRVIYINDPDGIEDIARALDIPVERTNTASAVAHGHMGAADQLVALGENLQRGEVAPGDIIALCGISIGFRWYCTLIQI